MAAATKSRQSFNCPKRGADIEPLWPSLRRSVFRNAGIGLLTSLLCHASIAGEKRHEPGQRAELRIQAQSYEHGEGVRKDLLRAIDLYCDAARMGDADAQFNLGWIYANGRGVPRDDALASFFFRLAAEQGHDHARRMIRFVGPVVAERPTCMRQHTVQVPSPPRPADFEAVDGGRVAQPRLVELVRKLAPEYGVYPKLALAVIRAESNFNPAAVSPKNAQGLMQLMPETSARFKVKKPFDPEENIRGGLAYLRWLLAYFRGNVALVAAAYNAGEGAVNRFKGIPPYAETKQYVKKIMDLVETDEHPFDPSVTRPSPELPAILKNSSGSGRKFS